MSLLPFSIFKQQGQEYEVVDKAARNALSNKADASRLGTDIPLYNQGGLWYARKNGICTIGFNGVAVAGTFSLPAGMWPAAYITLYGQDPHDAYMVVDATDGIIHYYADSTHRLFGVVSYPAKDAL